MHLNSISKIVWGIIMGIRFCKGIENPDYSISCNSALFLKAHLEFRNSSEKYLSLINQCGEYVCSCYDDTHLDKLIKYCVALESSTFGLKYLNKQYPVVTIVSFNELAYRLFLLFKKANCIVYCKGDLWDVLVGNEVIVSDIIGFPIYSEGNLGIPINESGMWSNAFPDNEFDFLRKVYNLVTENHKIYNREWSSGEKSNEILKQLILSKKPFMAGRLGNTEAAICYEYTNGYYTDKWLKWLTTTSGFFSTNSDLIKDVNQYARITIAAINNCDVHLCRFENEISVINKYSHNESYNFDWYSLYTGLTSNSWLSALKGKRVLIISSASETIKKQYQIKEKLFRDDCVLPEMILQYYVPPQTQLGNNKGNYSNWFNAFEKLFIDISKLEFDIAIIAAGAYGYPLASLIKNNLQKQAIELCSGIYPIFGIKVKTQLIIRKVSCMYNDYWCFPIEEKPNNYMDVENGAYWG